MWRKNIEEKIDRIISKLENNKDFREPRYKRNDIKVGNMITITEMPTQHSDYYLVLVLQDDYAECVGVEEMKKLKEHDYEKAYTFAILYEDVKWRSDGFNGVKRRNNF